MEFFTTEHLSVGYNGKALIRDICISLPKGKILTLIGPNGAGKSTILKSITRHLQKISGTVYVGNEDSARWSAREMARRMAVVLTDRVRPELTTCREVVAMGRYPYTGLFGTLTPADKEAVDAALARVHGEALADRDFLTLSDGQRQRILLARAICQDPETIVLDEPTAYLDIRHKIELLEILREMAAEKNVTVIMSLHEIDLAAKISDYLLCVKGETISAFGPPEEILAGEAAAQLYGIRYGAYDPLFGSVELERAAGEPDVFVVGGCGTGIPCYRVLQKRRVPFAAGILFENDLDVPVAKALGSRVVCAPAFSPIPESALREAEEALAACKGVIDTGAPVGCYNEANQTLLRYAERFDIPVYHGWQEWSDSQK